MTIEEGLLRRFLLDHPAEAGVVLEAHQHDAAAEILRALSDDAIAAALITVTPGFAAAVLAQWTVERIAEVLSLLDSASGSRILRRLDRELRSQVIELLPEQPRRGVEALLEYESNTAGALMDPTPPIARDDDEIGRSLRRIREESSSSMPYLYVVDSQLTLTGVLTTSDLLNANPEELIRSRMKPVTEVLSPKAGPRAILDHPGWKTLRALPVVDRQRHLLGVIRFGTYTELLTKLRGADAVTEVSTIEALGDLFFTGFSGLLEAATRSASTSDASKHTAALGDRTHEQTKG